MIGADLLPIQALGDVWGRGAPELYPALHQVIDNPKLSAEIRIQQLETASKNAGVPDDVLQHARLLAQQNFWSRTDGMGDLI